SEISSLQISFDCGAELVEQSVELRSKEPPTLGHGLVSGVWNSQRTAGTLGDYDLNLTFDSGSAAHAQLKFDPDAKVCKGKQITIAFDLQNMTGPAGHEGQWEMPAIGLADILGVNPNSVKGVDFTIAQGYLRHAEVMLPFKDANCGDIINSFAQS